MRAGICTSRDPLPTGHVPATMRSVSAATAGAILGLYWGCAGATLGQRWGNAGAMPGLCWGNAGVMPELRWGNAGTMLGLCWGNAGVMPELRWGNAGTMLLQCWGRTRSGTAHPPSPLSTEHRGALRAAGQRGGAIWACGARNSSAHSWSTRETSWPRRRRRGPAAAAAAAAAAGRWRRPAAAYTKQIATPSEQRDRRRRRRCSVRWATLVWGWVGVGLDPSTRPPGRRRRLQLRSGTTGGGQSSVNGSVNGCRPAT